MTRTIRNAALGLLWLALGATTFGSPFTVTVRNFAVDIGGGFEANTTDPNNQFEVFCADYLNGVSPPQTYDANISILSAGISNTRYGTTPQTSFLFQTVPAGQPTAGQALGDAFNRYLLAGWLTTQYDFSADANTGSRDIGIQSAIWNLLNVNGGSPQTGDVDVWLSNARAWENSQTGAQLNAFAANVRIYTSVDVAGLSGTPRYTTGMQEMVNVFSEQTVSVAPEPAAFLLLGTGLVGIGVIARRKKASQLLRR